MCLCAVPYIIWYIFADEPPLVLGVNIRTGSALEMLNALKYCGLRLGLGLVLWCIFSSYLVCLRRL